MSEPGPKVSVVMITYNHEKFIEQAVNSVLMQETDFDYEIIIGEDCSTDRTREILIELQKQRPDKIKLVLNPQNLGMIPNFVKVLSMARGEYIALLEGDDYWTSPHKLQIQVDYLDSHFECSLCFHAFAMYSEDTHQIVCTKQHVGGRQLRDKATYGLNDLLKFDLHPKTCSVMYRLSSVKLPEWSVQVINGDTVLLFLAAQSGRFGFLDQNLATYRLHSHGVWSSTSNLSRQIQSITTYEYLNQHFRFVYRQDFALRRRYLKLARSCQHSGASAEAKYYLRKALFHPNGGKPVLLNEIKAIVIIYIPFLYALYRRLRMV